MANGVSRIVGDDRQDVMKLLEEKETPMHYINSAAIGLSLSDITMVGMVDGMPTCRVNMSFTMAKTIAQTLMEVVGQVEDMMQHKIFTLDDMGEAVKLLEAEEKGEGVE